jgi:hypothetical protein
MDNAARLAIFQAQVRNVRSLGTARKHVRRAINAALRNGDDAMAAVHTKVLAQLFCAWAEVNFSKVVHTSHGFTLDEIRQIKGAWRNSGITQGWMRCVELGLGKIPVSDSNFLSGARKRLKQVIKDYVSDPSLVRNKLAHGQWTVALNSSNTAINAPLTKEFEQLTIVQVEIWFECHQQLALIIESLIESPNRAFTRDYMLQLRKLDLFLEASKTWSIAERVRLLKKKDWKTHPAFRVEPRRQVLVGPVYAVHRTCVPDRGQTAQPQQGGRFCFRLARGDAHSACIAVDVTPHLESLAACPRRPAKARSSFRRLCPRSVHGRRYGASVIPTRTAHAAYENA